MSARKGARCDGRPRGRTTKGLQGYGRSTRRRERRLRRQLLSLTPKSWRRGFRRLWKGTKYQPPTNRRHSWTSLLRITRPSPLSVLSSFHPPFRFPPYLSTLLATLRYRNNVECWSYRTRQLHSDELFLCLHRGSFLPCTHLLRTLRNSPLGKLQVCSVYSLIHSSVVSIGCI